MQVLQLEHVCTPGESYEECLIYSGGGFVLNEMDLNEATDAAGGKIIRFRGKFQEADAVNKNKRMYPKCVLDSSLERLEEAIKNG